MYNICIYHFNLYFYILIIILTFRGPCKVVHLSYIIYNTLEQINVNKIISRTEYNILQCHGN